MDEPADVLYHHVTRELACGRLTPFLGAGVNLVGVDEAADFVVGERLPNGAELARELALNFDYPDADSAPDLVRVAQWVESEVGRSDLEEFLRRMFNRDFPLTSVHEVLASTPEFVRRQPIRDYPLIITTNYDDALERAFAERGEEVDVLTYVAWGQDKGLFRHSGPGISQPAIVRPANEYPGVTLKERPVVLKLHGAVSRSESDDDIDDDSYVVTEDDYVECLAQSEIVDNLPPEVARRMRRCHYLFLGYSLRDWNLRVMLHRFRKDQIKQTNSWAVVRTPDLLEQAAWRSRKVEIYRLDLGVFATRLAAELDEAGSESAVE